jgi:hypothetical protein
MSFPTWLSDASANRYIKTYIKDFLDLSGNLYIQNGGIYTPLNSITFNDTTGFINFSNSYFGSAVYIYNPSTSSNIDVVAYVNDNNSNITSINSSITSANSSISSINGKIGTLGWDSIYDFTTVNNLFINPGGVLQYEDSFGNHPDLIASVITNTSNIANNTSSINTLNGQISTANSNITTLQGKVTNITFSTPTTTISNTTALSTCNISVNLRVDGSLLLNAGALTLTNANLQKIQFLSTVSSDIQTQTTTLSTKLTNVTFSTPTTTISNTTALSTCNISSNLRVDGSLLLNAGALTLTNANLQKIQYLSTVSSDIQTQTTSNGTSISTLNTKTTAISYSSPTTTIAGTTAMTNATLTGNLVINNGLTTYSNSDLLKIKNILTSTSDLQTQINNFNAVGLNGNNTYTGVQTYNGNIVFSALLNNVSSTTFSYISGLTSSAQTQLDNKGGLAIQNNWTNGNNFRNQLTGDYIVGSALTGSPTEFSFTGQRPWASGSSAAGDNVYELSFDTGFYNRGLTIQGGCKNTLSGTGMKSCFGLYYRQYVTGGTDPTRNAILYGEDSETGVINNTLVCPSSLRLDGSLKVGTSGGTTITNTQLGYLSSLSSNVQSAIDSHTTSITSLTSKNTDISYVASPAVTSIANKLQTSVLAFSTSLNSVSSTVFNYISGLTSDLQTTLTSITNRQQIGSIMQHPKGNIGSPYLLANGAAVSRTTYSALFASYGTLYGSGDGSTTFNLPNYQACFLRSYGAGVTIGSSTYSTAAVGSAQNDAIQGHNHSPQSGQFLSTTLASTSTNGVASVAIQKNNPSNFGNTGGVINANSGSETVPTHSVVYTYVLAL